MNQEDMQRILNELRRPFHPSQVTWKPGTVKGERAIALAYADPRAYMNRLDEVCGLDWAVAYEPWGETRIICRLTIMGITRSSTGEMAAQDEKNEIGGTVAEAQALKRACAMFGLGRYLYNLPTGWADYDPQTKRFTDKAKAKLIGILVQHYRRATDSKGEMADLFQEGDGGQGGGQQQAVASASSTKDLSQEFHTLGEELYGDQWEHVCTRNVQRVSNGKITQSGELSAEQLQKLIAGMQKLKSQREPVAA